MAQALQDSPTVVIIGYDAPLVDYTKYAIF
jgi:glycosyltransferase A (GT-A) superfamily protein (DUF2064 family)